MVLSSTSVIVKMMFIEKKSAVFQAISHFFQNNIVKITFVCDVPFYLSPKTEKSIQMKTATETKTENQDIIGVKTEKLI